VRLEGASRRLEAASRGQTGPARHLSGGASALVVDALPRFAAPTLGGGLSEEFEESLEFLESLERDERDERGVRSVARRTRPRTCRVDDGLLATERDSRLSGRGGCRQAAQRFGRARERCDRIERLHPKRDRFSLTSQCRQPSSRSRRR
jgi:hypothetical protein